MEMKSLLRKIPKMDILMEQEKMQSLSECYGYDSTLEAARQELDSLRAEIVSALSVEKEEPDSGNGEKGSMTRLQEIAVWSGDGLMEELIARIDCRLADLYRPDIRKVLNGTGTILHTNLGRAPLGEKELQQVIRIAGGYSNLEYDLEAGKRGERYSHFEKLLCRITGAESAMAVNNNAGAVLLVLSSLAKGGEVIVSRGELVEIGGKFRIPDVMEQSGAVLREVGTTNKTHLSDYEEAVTEETKALLKVHTSNYRIVGFTESVPAKDLVSIKEKYGIPIIDDLGSGVLVDLSKYGITYEPTVQDSLRNGADVVCFSGDKLLGGPQAGIIVGKREYIERMKKNPLTRALRIDKFTATALESVLHAYLSEEKAVETIPVLRMITRKAEDVLEDAKRLSRMLKRAGLKAEIGVESCESQIGGGSLPLERIPSAAVTIRPLEISTSQLEERLRHLEIPVVARTINDKIMLDMRTFEAEYMSWLVKILRDGRVLEGKTLSEIEG